MLSSVWLVSFAQTAFRDVSPMEMSLCSASLRFLSFIADKAKMSSACRQLFLVSGGIRASLFASAVYPPSSSLRRLAMEVVRHIRRRDLDELAQHVRMHDGLLPSAMTSAGMHINVPYVALICIKLCGMITISKYALVVLKPAGSSHCGISMHEQHLCCAASIKRR